MANKGNIQQQSRSRPLLTEPDISFGQVDRASSQPSTTYPGGKAAQLLGLTGYNNDSEPSESSFRPHRNSPENWHPSPGYSISPETKAARVLGIDGHQSYIGQNVKESSDTSNALLDLFRNRGDVILDGSLQLTKESKTSNRLQKMPKSNPSVLTTGSKVESKPKPQPISTTATAAQHIPSSPSLSPNPKSYGKGLANQKDATLEPPTALTSTQPTETGDPEEHPPRSPITAIPQFPPSPSTSSPKHGRDASKSFFSNLKASKSSNRLHMAEPGHKSSSKTDVNSRASSKDRRIYSSRTHGSTPDLHAFISSADCNNGKHLSPRNGFSAIDSCGTADVTGTQEPLDSHQPENEIPAPLSSKKSKTKFGLLNRSRSIRLDDQPRSFNNGLQAHNRPQTGSDNEDTSAVQDFQEPMRTAPLQTERDRSFWGSANRNRSADRQPQHSQDDLSTRQKKERTTVNASNLSTSANSPWSTFKNAGSKAADGIRTGKVLLNKMVRSGSSNERDQTPEVPHTLHVINKPLVEQTRKTRISKKLESSKDKTEFWMPALPWRCIDYLNANGCEEEGLYRVPGSGKDVKHWQKRFDTELDINLFEQTELYDINTIGSMFKTWLRELPDEILPKATQARIAEQCQGAKTTPQMMKDELSRLPPFNYYLLFAITCHLSLLLSYKEVNRMDYRNLCICFQPCMKIDAFCFMFLVCDWKNCWQGCWTEKQFLEVEYNVEDEGEIARQVTRRRNQSDSSETAIDDRNLSSSEGHTAEGERRAPQLPGSQAPLTVTSKEVLKEEMAGMAPQTSDQLKTESKRLSLGPPLSPIKIE